MTTPICISTTVCKGSFFFFFPTSLPTLVISYLSGVIITLKNTMREGKKSRMIYSKMWAEISSRVGELMVIFLWSLFSFLFFPNSLEWGQMIFQKQRKRGWGSLGDLEGMKDGGNGMWRENGVRERDDLLMGQPALKCFSVILKAPLSLLEYGSKVLLSSSWPIGTSKIFGFTQELFVCFQFDHFPFWKQPVCKNNSVLIGSSLCWL